MADLRQHSPGLLGDAARAQEKLPGLLDLLSLVPNSTAVAPANAPAPVSEPAMAPAPIRTPTPEERATMPVLPKPKVPTLADTNPDAFAPVEIEEAEPAPAFNLMETPQFKDISRRRAELDKKKDAALVAQQVAISNGQVAENAAIEQHNKEQAALDKEEAEARKKITDRIEAQVAEVAAEQQKLEAIKPQDFWTRADTGDKVMMALAVFVSAIGQGLSGGKENAALKALDSAMNRDQAEYEARLKKRLSIIDQKRQGLGDIRDTESRFEVGAQARKQAANTHLNNLLDQLARTAQGNEAKAKIEQVRAAVDQDTLENDQAFQLKSMEMAANAGGGGGGISQEQALASLAPQRNGVPLSLNEAKGKSLGFLKLNESRVKTLEDIEKDLSPSEFKALTDAVGVLMDRENIRTIPGFGPMFTAANEAIFSRPKEYFEKVLPGKGGRYWQALRDITKDQTRFVTGASIKDSELMNEMITLVPTPGTSMKDIGTFSASRRQLLESHRAISGVQKPLFYEAPRRRK